MENEMIQAFWRRFLAAKGLSQDTRMFSVFAFCGGGPLADLLLGLVLSGEKTATTSSVNAYLKEGEEMADPGSYHVVLDAQRTPRCVIQITAADVYPFNEMTYDLIRDEGEDDSLESWQETHLKLFQAEGEQLGFVFTEDMPVLFEHFAVVYRED